MSQSNRLCCWTSRVLCLLGLLGGLWSYPQAAIALPSNISPMLNAIASVHTYPEAADQVMWRSLQTLRDDSNQAWQVVFYKRVKAGQLDCLNLRLVGFPGRIDLAHATPLSVTAGNGKHWSVGAVFTTPLTANAAEYDLQQLMRELTSDPPLHITIPLDDRPAATLLVPPFVVKEWREVSQREISSMPALRGLL